MKLYKITVGDCSIQLMCNEKVLSNLVKAVQKTYPTQKIGYVLVKDTDAEKQIEIDVDDLKENAILEA